MAAARLQRWALILSAYKYDLMYLMGEENQEADLLSRLPLQVHIVDANQELYHLEHCDLLVTAAEVATKTQVDPVLRKVYQMTLQGWRQSGSKLTTEGGCLLWRTRVVFPPKLRPCVLEELHENQSGASRIKALARSFVWWPNLDITLKDICRSCETCQSKRNKPTTGISHPSICTCMGESACGLRRD